MLFFGYGSYLKQKVFQDIAARLDILYYGNIVQVLKTGYKAKCTAKQTQENIVQDIIKKPYNKTMNKKIYNMLLKKKAKCEPIKGKWEHVRGGPFEVGGWAMLVFEKKFMPLKIQEKKVCSLTAPK